MSEGIVQLPPNPKMPQNGSTSVPPEQVTQLEDQFDFPTAKIRLEAMINDWEYFREKARSNRKMRDVEFSVEVLRREGTLDEDETMIPVRIIDTNITREQPPYINYLKNSRRLCIFTCQDNPDCDTDKLELEFTKGMTYLNWENAHYKAIDGAATHGWDSVEVVFDSSKPLNVGIEHVGFDQLYWPRTCKNIQQAPCIIRAYDFSIIELQKFVTVHGWDATQVNMVIAARKGGKKEGETARIHKEMFKKDGVIYVGWFCIANGCSDWLKAPQSLYIGIDNKSQQVDPMSGQPTTSWEPAKIKDYPYFILPYRESEKPKLVEKHGRCFLDGNKQEAQTSVLSSFVNGLNRATKIIASPEQDDGTGNSVREIADTPLEGGVVLNKPMQFYNAPYPDFQILKALQYMDVANSQETNQTNFAVMNREDSRKTAKEMSLAETQSNLLNSVQLTLFSSYIRGIYSLTWLIVQSQALQGNIKFLLVNNPKPQINPLTQQPMFNPQTQQPMMQDNWENDVKTIGYLYDIRAAGDVDVIQRDQLIQQMKQDWPVIQNTPLASEFLADLLMLSYPAKGEQYAKVVAQGQQNQLQQDQQHLQQSGQLIAGLTTALQEFVKQHGDLVQKLPPDKIAQLGQLMLQGENVIKSIQQKGPHK